MTAGGSDAGQMLFVGRRGAAAARFKRLWREVSQHAGATSVVTRDLTDLRATFPNDDDAEYAADHLMSVGFAVFLAEGERVVQGFPAAIQDDATGEPTRLEGFDR